MIEAILMKKGRKLKVFILSINGDMERLAPKTAACWQENKERFCELKKGSHRISFFRYPEDRVLLAAHFVKHRAVEQAEYDRALRQKSRFDAAMIWRE
jgi:hypothetical protein